MRERSRRREGDRGGSSKGATPPHNRRRKRFLFLTGVLASAVACVYALIVYHKAHAQVRTFSTAQASFGLLAPSTSTERELEQLLVAKDEDIDLGLANWLVAADVPQFADLTRAAYFDKLDAMTQLVRQEMERRQATAKSRGRNRDAPETRCAAFCGAMIKLGFAYREAFAQHDLTPAQTRGLYADANNVFLAGLVRTMRGSCVSMPLIYVVIGQRLGLPVHLVQVGKHAFLRWQEPGFRMNVETTAVDRVWVTEDDSAYLEEEGMTREHVTGNELQNLSNREVIGSLLYARSAHWVMKAEREYARSWVDLSRAFHLSPNDPAIAKAYQGIFRQFGLKPEDTMTDLKRIESEVRRKETAASGARTS